MQGFQTAILHEIKESSAHHERAAPAALALTGACIKAACCICHLLVCMHDARLASRAGHLACTHIHTVARAVTVYRCTFCPPSCTSDMRACFAVRAVRSYRWNSWMRACICAFPCCACGSWWRCMYVHVYIREMRVLRLEGGTSGGVVDF